MIEQIDRPQNIQLEYFPPQEDLSRGSSDVVLRIEGSEQYIMGPQNVAYDIARAFQFLTDLGVPAFTMMSILVVPEYETNKDVTTHSISKSLLARFGLMERLRGSDFGKDFNTLEINPNLVGVRADLRDPIHTTSDLYNSGWEKYESAIPILYASEIVHEWAHVGQHREDLPTYSLWSEQHALSVQVDLLRKALRQLPTLAKNTNSAIENWMEFLMNSIEAYRNGRDFSNHLLEPYLQGTPLKEQNLYIE